MKNNADALFFTHEVCAGASQTSVIASENSPSRNSPRVPSLTLRNEWKKMKKGYHSTQRKIWGMFPASEFYGFVLGYAVAFIIKGILNWETSMLQVILAAVGVAIGFWYDRKYFWVEDEPGEAGDASEDGEESMTEFEGTKSCDVLPDPDESMQKRLKRMFDRQAEREEKSEE